MERKEQDRVRGSLVDQIARMEIFVAEGREFNFVGLTKEGAAFRDVEGEVVVFKVIVKQEGTDIDSQVAEKTEAVAKALAREAEALAKREKREKEKAEKEDAKGKKEDSELTE